PPASLTSPLARNDSGCPVSVNSASNPVRVKQNGARPPPSTRVPSEDSSYCCRVLQNPCSGPATTSRLPCQPYAPPYATPASTTTMAACMSRLPVSLR